MSTVDELITELRQDFLQDTDSRKYGWSDEQLLRYLNEAIKEACRAPIFKTVQTFSVVAGTAEYELEEYTQDIDQVFLALQTEPLIQTTKEQLSYRLSWREDEGTPLHFVQDTTLLLYPIPIVADTMTVYSFAIPEKLGFGETPEIPERYHQCLLYWGAYKAYMNPTFEFHDLTRSQQFLSMFDQAFGIKRSARYNTIQMNSPKYNTVAPVRMC